jgi:hypothetical protein
MIVRGITGAVGFGLLGATAHTTIQATGGYAGAHAVLTLAIAAGVATAALAIGGAWASGRRGLAAWLIATVIAGELFGLVMTAERIIDSREAAQAPLRAAGEVQTKAKRRVDLAEQAWRSTPASSPRLQAALEAKRTADADAASKSTERGCRENCRQLLQAQVDSAEREVTAAREAIEQKRTTAERELASARAALAGVAVPRSATPLADRVGVSAWVIDLITAALGSLAANGLAVGLIAFVAHGRQRAHEIVPPAPAASSPSIEPLPSSAPAAVERFAFEHLFPARSDEGVDVAAIEARVMRWCAQQRIEAPRAELGRAMGDLFAAAGIPVERRGGKLMAMGLKLKDEQAALPAPGRLGRMHNRKVSVA